MGLSLGVGAPTNGAPILDPSTLALSLWVRASFASSPWVGKASAGASAGRSLTEATNPPGVGAALNGFTPADFDGVAKQLQGPNWSGAGLASNTAGSVVVLFKVRTAVATAGNPALDPCLVVDNTGSGAQGLAFTTSGLGALLTSTGSKIKTLACSTGAWHLGIMRWDAANLYLRVDQVDAAPLALGATTISSSLLNVGRNYNGTKFLDGLIEEIMMSATTFSDATCDQIRAYVNARYGLAL